MVKIIQQYRRPSPLAGAIERAAQTYFGNRLRSQLMREQHRKLSGENDAMDRLSTTLGDPVLADAMRSGQDVSKFNLFRQAQQADSLDDQGLNRAQLGTGMAAGSTGWGFAAEQARRQAATNAQIGESRRAATARVAESRRASDAALAQREDQFDRTLVTAIDPSTGLPAFTTQGAAQYSGLRPPVPLSQQQAALLGAQMENGTLTPEQQRAATGAAPTMSEVQAASTQQIQAGTLMQLTDALPSHLRLPFLESVPAMSPQGRVLMHALLADPGAAGVDPTGTFATLMPAGGEELARALLALPPETRQELARHIGDDLRAGDAAARPRPAPTARYVGRDGQAYVSADGGRTDATTGALVPADAVEITGAGASVTSLEALGGVPLQKSVNVDLQRQITGADNFLLSLGHVKDLYTRDPNAFGTLGAMSTAGRGVAAALEAIGQVMGTSVAADIQAAVQQAQLDDNMDPGVRAQLDFTNPNLTTLETYERAMAYKLARMRDSGAKISDQDYKQNLKDVSFRGLLTSEAVVARMQALEREARDTRAMAIRMLRGGTVVGGSPGAQPPPAATPPLLFGHVPLVPGN